MPNVIILTTGSSGSSVLAGLIAREGFWIGGKTAHLDFNTYENAELVELNISLLRHAGYPRRDANDLPPPDVNRLEALCETQDIGPYRDFVEECHSRQPWLWKDPRLAYTLHFWRHIADLRNVKYILITREFRQAYAGLIHSRKVYMSPEQYEEINLNYLKSIDLFVKQMDGVDMLKLTFEQLIIEPEATLRKINAHLGTSVSLESLKTVYRGTLYRKRYRPWDYVTALAKFHIKKMLGDVVRFPRMAG